MIKQLDEMTPYSKLIEGFLRFEYPHCHLLRATVNPKSNIAHCFCCQKISRVELEDEQKYLLDKISDFNLQNPFVKEILKTGIKLTEMP